MALVKISGIGPTGTDTRTVALKPGDSTKVPLGATVERLSGGQIATSGGTVTAR
jgi:mannose-6-phosphate isomerase-like protein (cupin superfamily)